MSFSDEYLKLRQERLAKEKENRDKRSSNKSSDKSSSESSGSSFEETYLKLREERLAQEKKKKDESNKKSVPTPSKTQEKPVKEKPTTPLTIGNKNLKKNEEQSAEKPTDSSNKVGSNYLRGDMDIAPTVGYGAYSNLDPKKSLMPSEDKEDIAPIRGSRGFNSSNEGVQKWHEGWLKKGTALSDGYDIGDVARTLISSDADVATNLISGVVGWGEDAIDAVLTAAGIRAEEKGDYEKAEKLKEMVSEDKYDPNEVSRKLLKSGALSRMPVIGNVSNALSLITSLDDWINTKEVDNGFDGTMMVREDNSIFDEKADGFIQSTGEAITKMGISSATGGLLSDAITGITVYGSQAEEALRNDATFKQAGGSALISAAAEIVFEKLSGGIKFGGVTLDEGATRLISKNISNVALKNGLHFASDVAGESLEDVLTEFVSRLGTKLYKEEDLGEILFSEEALQDYISSAIASGLMGGSFNASNAINSTNSGRDYKTELNSNEQKVVEKEIENRIAKLEEDGKKLTKKEKNKLYEQVIEDMDSGLITLDTIEETLGGDAFKAYKDAADAEEALKTEHEELGKKTNATLAEQARYNELSEQLKDTSKREGLKKQLEQGVYQQAKNSRLINSYIESVRANQKFEADPNKEYKNEAAKKTVENIVNSGLLTNQVSSHRFVDFLTNIAEDKGIEFRLYDNKTLAADQANGNQYGINVDVSKVQGFITGDKKNIVLNINSRQALNSVVGHEITHALEDAKVYQQLQESIFRYARKTGEYAKLVKEFKDTYKNVTDEEFNQELTSELVGRYLFTDANFVNNLSVEQPNIFQKVWNEIKYLYKMATAGSTEARELARVKKLFEEAYREGGKAKNTSNTTQYSLFLSEKDVPDYLKSGIRTNKNRQKRYEEGKQLVISTEAEFDSFVQKAIDGNPDNIVAYGKVDKLLADKVKDASNARIDVEGSYLELSSDDVQHAYREHAKAKESGDMDMSIDDFLYALKNVNQADVVGAAVHKDGSQRVTLAVPTDDGMVMLVELASKSAGSLRLKTGWKTTTEKFDGKYKSSLPSTGNLRSTNTVRDNTASIDNLAQDSDNVKYSLSDSSGRKLSMKQMEYFKESKVTDDNGNLKVMYHGTPNGDFTVFKDGTYFTDNKEYADVYQNPGASSISSGKVASNPKTFEVYLNIKKPFDINDAEARDIYINDYIKGGNAMGINPYLSDAEYDKINSIDWTEGEDLRDFLIENEYDYDGLVLDEGATGGYGDDVKSRGKSYVVFSPEQVKNTDNLNPTLNPDIRYSLTEYSTEEKKAHNKAVVEYFGKTYRWSETGYVLLDGTKLDLSGKHEGAPGGYRTVDHRDIADALGDDYGDDTYSGALVQFMSEGNIRISPESNGMNLSVKPNKAQELSLQDFISKARGEVMLDIDDPNGYTVISMEYPRGTHSSRVLNDIREWFDNGKKPVVSDLSQFRYSLDHGGEYAPSGDWNIYGEDIRYKGEIAPPVAYKTKATVAENTPVAPVMDDEPIGDSNMFPDDPTLQADDSEDRFMSLDDTDAPVWMDDSSPEPTEDSSKPDDPFMERDWKDVGNRKVNAYMYENPEVKSFFQEEAQAMLGDLQNSQKGERWYNDEVYYDSGGEYGWSGTERTTTDDIAYLLDEGHYTYDQIEKGLKAIIEDNGKENNACSKRIEFLLNDRLRDGYTDMFGEKIPPNQEYLDMLEAKQVTEYSEESWNALTDSQTFDIAPPVENTVNTVDNIPPTDEHPVKEMPKQENKVAKIVYGEKPQRKKLSAWKWAKEHIFSHGAIFEDLSLKTGNRELQAKFDKIRRAESMAQHFIGKGKNNVSALNDVRTAVEKSGKTEAFNDYMYHMHNIDRMSLETEENRVLREGLKKKLKGYSKKQIEALAMEYIRKDTPKDMRDKIETARAYIDSLKGKNKPVFGDSVTADVSKQTVAKLEAENPEFKEYAEEIYGINKYLRDMLVENGIISMDTAAKWNDLYPHYVPIHRTNHDGQGIDVPLNTNRTGVNAPIKRATGGNGDIYDLFSTMAERVEQTYKAVTKNRFGVELKNTLETTIDSTDISGMEELLDSLDQHEDLLQKGENGESATFTVFENGKRVKFEITDEMYEAMKPSQFTGTIAPLNKINNLRRNVLTTYSPTFALTNPIKDIQDILINSQHPARTYFTIPEAIKEVLSKGHWYQERMENGGDQDSYFDGQKKTFKGEKSKLSKIVGFPFEKIQSVNEVIEQVPRLAEYIASRKMGRSIDVSMLDSARVTTNFGASGDLTNMLNRNGATFLSASVEGFNQQVRNVREAKAEGIKGWAKLAAKTMVAGLPALLLNHALWDDDEEYEELSDYVKQNYYIVAKFGDGQFVRIPKGRTVSVIQNAFEQMENMITGNDEVDLKTFGDLVLNNLAPNWVGDNWIGAPITQAIGNKAWYGGDLVPTRLQNLPSAEQYDETTDSISKWLGEATNTSPYKWNYILDQYSGGVGDMVLPRLTPSADGGGFGAAMRDKFTADSTLDNQNVTDFYDKKDELTTNANSMYATDKDTLKSRYINAVGSEMSKLYTEKRKIQSSDLSDEEKAAKVREVQRQIDDLAKNGLDTYNNVTFEDDYREGGEYARIGDYVFKKNDKGEWSKLSDEQLAKYETTRKAGDASYATDGENHYRWYVPGEDSKEEPGWRKITDDQLEKQEEVTSGLGITAEEYWDNKDEYDYAYKNPENYAVSKAVGGYDTYKKYSSELYDIKADKDKNGKSISGSRKEKVIDYINNLDADYGEKIILFKIEYPADDTYNAEIVEYLNDRDDISYDEMVTILKELGMNVSSDGTVTWD